MLIDDGLSEIEDEANGEEDQNNINSTNNHANNEEPEVQINRKSSKEVRFSTKLNHRLVHESIREAEDEENEESGRSLHENSHKSIEKLIKVEEANQDCNYSHSNSIQECNTNLFGTSSLKKDMDTLAKTLDANKELPANQQEGSAYDQRLKSVKEEDKIIEIEGSKDDIEILNDEEFNKFGSTIKPFISLEKRKSSK